MHIIFHAGMGRYKISSTTGRDDAFFSDGTGRYILVFTTGRDGTDIFSARETAIEDPPALGTTVAALQVIRRTWYHICHHIFGVIRPLLMGINLYLVICNLYGLINRILRSTYYTKG